MRLTERRIAERAMFMQAAYIAADGRVLKNFDYMDIGETLGLEEEATKLLADELYRRGYIDGVSFRGRDAHLTEHGLDIVETMETLETPPPRPEEWGIAIGDVTNSVVNINTKNVNSKQSVKEAKEKWWSSLGPAAASVIRALFLSMS